MKHFGPYGLWFSSFFLIPFDFVARCYFQEKYKGFKLALVIFGLIFSASFITIILNTDAWRIAMGSIAGFSIGTIASSFIYKLLRKKSWFVKVNSSDFAAICCDSGLFQLIAFGIINPYVMGGQVIVKFIGGLAWCYILFIRLKIQERI